MEVNRVRRTRSKNQKSIAGIIEPKIKQFIPLFSSRNHEQRTEPSNVSSNQPPRKRKTPVQYKPKPQSPRKPDLSKIIKEVSSEKKNPRVWEQLYEERLAKEKRMEQLAEKNNQMQQQKQELENQQCTFQPQLNSNSMQIAS